jgi:Flp pilus assembly protein TadD
LSIRRRYGGKSSSIAAGRRTAGKFVLSCFAALSFVAAFIAQWPLFAQDRPGQQPDIRGDRAELSVIIKDGSSQLIGPLVSVKIYYNGAIEGQKTTSKGRAVFILNRLGDYTITAEALGYRTAQKDISIRIAVDAEEQIILQRDSSEALGAAGRPVLAPKAKEALDKALQALDENKLDQADRHITEAVSLAPNHPDVLYVQGIILLRRGQSQLAEQILEKTTQIDPKNARAFTALGMAFINENKYDQAITPLQQSIQLDPANWETHWTLARAFYRQEQFEESLKESTQALAQAHGAEPAIELLIAQAQAATGKFEDSAETLRTFIKNHPNDKGVATAKKWLDRLAADGKIRKR